MRRSLTLIAIAAACLLAAACVPKPPPPPAPESPVLNEFSASTVGTDVEYLEVFASAGVDYSAYSILEIEGDSPATGVVDEVVPVGTTDSSGLWKTDLAANSLENGTITLLLVKGFTGVLGDDLDTDGDGTFDVTPWSEVADGVGVNDGGATDTTYAVPSLGVAYDGLPFAPGGASRIPDGTDTDTAADWVRNDFDLAPIQAGTPIDGEALNTPGTPNQVVPPAPPVPPMINEVDADTVGTDTAEFVEIYADPGTPLDGLALVLYNGATDVSYGAFDLDGQVTDAGGYVVVCGSAAVVPTCDLDVTPDTDLVQNGQDAVALYQADASAFPTGTAVTATGLVDALVYDTSDADDPGLLAVLTPGQPQVDENGSANGTTQSNQRCPDATGGRLVTTGYGQGSPTPGAADACVAPPATTTPIHTIQGSRPAPDPATDTPTPSIGDPADDSPLKGQTVTIEGIVTGWDDLAGQSNAGAVFQNERGIYVQEEDAQADADLTTSEGVFVPFGSATDSVAAFPVGSLVRVSGTVLEHFELTTVTPASVAAITVVSSANPVPAATAIDPATAGRNRYEQLEGMRVTLAEAVANVGGTNKFGELFVTPGPTKDRLFRTEPDPGLLALAADAGAANPAIPRKPTVPSSTYVPADLFDTIVGATGPLAYSFDQYKVLVQPGAMPTVVDDPSVTYPFTLPAADPGQLRIAAFNVENFFGVGGDLDGSPVTAAEYGEKRDRIVDAVANRLSRPDIVGVAEVDNLTILTDVATQLGGYTAHLAEGNDNRGIDVGYLVKDGVAVTAVTQIGLTAPNPTAATCSDVSGRLFDRPPLRLDVTVGTTPVSLFMNHFSSKAAPDSCRDAQAAYVAAQVGPIEAGGGEAIVMGDLNAFENETPLAVLEDPGSSLDNLWDTVPDGLAYSFQFDGRLQTLDHVLVTDGLVPLVAGFEYAHFDNDYYDRYEVGTGPAQPDGTRVSDHDPPVLTLAVP